MKLSKIFYLLLFFSLTSFAEISPTILNAADPAVQFYTQSARDSYRLPMGIEKGVVIEFNSVVRSVLMDDEQAYSMIPGKDRRRVSLYAHLPVKNVITVITDDQTYVFNTAFPGNALPRVLYFKEREAADGGLISKPLNPQQGARPDSGFGSPGFAYNGEAINKNYHYKGSAEIAPRHAFDNGKFTVMKFGRKAPLVYEVLRDGGEKAVNFHTEDEYMIIHSVAKQFTVRLGRLSACVFNRGYIND